MPAKSSTLCFAALAVVLITATLMLATEPRLAIVWDEGYTLGREARLRLWFRALADPVAFASTWEPPSVELVQQVGAPPPRRDQLDTRVKLLFDPRILAWFWPFAREEPHGHPPFYALVGLVGDVLTPWRADLQRARFGPMLMFSLTAGFLFFFVSKRWGLWAGTAATGAWVFQPNLFAHGHYATYDAILTSLWLSATLAFACAVGIGFEVRRLPSKRRNESIRRPLWFWVVIFGLLLGLAADTKLTGWFLPIPLLVWTGLYRSRRGIFTLLAGGAIAALTLYLLNPPWWTEPITAVARFFESNLSRGKTIPIQTLFLGQVVSTPDGSLPWYNTVLWTIFVTPVGFLCLALIGVVGALKTMRTEPFGLLAIGQWSFLLVLRALPHTPGHDGIRQFLPAFGMLALVAGPGAASLIQRLGTWGKALTALALAEGAISVALMMPVPLSYYSPLLRGLPGATALGMEPTFYWDALSDEALAWLSRNTATGQKVRFATFPTSWLYLREQGRLPFGLLPNEPGTWAWYVVQNRPGAFSPLDRALTTQGKAAFVVWKSGVPLIWVFPYDQVESFFSGRGLETERPTSIRGHRTIVGHVPQLLGQEQPILSTLAGSLTGGLRRRGRSRIVGRSRGFADNLGGCASGSLVTKTADIHFLVATTAKVLEKTTLGGRRANRNRLADRSRGRARLNNHARGGCRNVTALLLVTGRGVGSGKNAENARQGQDEQVASHEVKLLSLMQWLKITQSASNREFGRFRCPARILRLVQNRHFAKPFLQNESG